MDATRWMPRIGAACAAVMLLVLAVPAAQASEVRKEDASPGGLTQRIHFFDLAAESDDIVVSPADDGDGDQFVVFTPQDGDTLATNGNPCSGPVGPPNGRACQVFDTFVEILIDAGGGDDTFNLQALPDPGTPSDDRDLPAVFNAGAGDDWFLGSRNPDRIDGGPGDDHVMGVGDGDRYTGGEGTDTIEFQGPAAWAVSLDGIANDGPKNGGSGNVDPDVEVILGWTGADRFTGAAGKQTIDGRGGDDTLDGGPNGDALVGGPGDDTILARDGAPDTIDCGDGTDTVTADWNDVLIVGSACESVSRSVRDDDGDGAAHGADCNDDNPAIKPGAGDIPGNGVDEDCDGSDAVADRDGDGAAAAVDCDDANPARRPGATDVPANGIDEDCDGRDAAIPALRPVFAASWKVFGNGTELTKLRVQGAPKSGAKLSIRCKGKGCPFKRKSVKLRNGAANLTKRFKGKRLRPGVVIELRVTAAGTIGKVQRLTIRKRKEPKRVTLCLAPGASKPKKCG